MNKNYRTQKIHYFAPIVNYEHEPEIHKHTKLAVNHIVQKLKWTISITNVNGFDADNWTRQKKRHPAWVCKLTWRDCKNGPDKQSRVVL